MRILVTGGAGFLGSHVAESLRESSHNVGILDARTMGKSADNKTLGLAYDMRDRIEEVDFLPQTDCIVHAAARADVAYNWSDPIERYRLQTSNVDGTMNILERANDFLKPPSIVFISTCAVYGDNSQCFEGDAVVATSPYAASKLAAEALVQAYAHKWGAPWYVLRPGCMVGSRYHHGHIADFVRMAREGKVKPKSDGTGKKSFVHVLDVVDMIGMCVRNEVPSGVYNMASGTWAPKDTIRVMGVEGITTWPETGAHGWVGDPMAVSSSGKARAAGWVARRSIEQGVRESLASLGWA